MAPDYLLSPTVWTLMIGCFVFTLALTPYVMRFANMAGVVDRGGHRQVFEGENMPLLGGLAIGIPFVVVCLLQFFPYSSMFNAVSAHRSGFTALAAGCCGIMLLGVIDDSRGMRARAKFIGQFMMAVFPCLSGYTIQGLDIPGHGRIAFDPIVGTALTMLWVVGLTNAYNLIDGIDGLASGLALIAAMGLALISIMNGSTFPALMCVALIGSLAAFMIYNFHPARIFLGDTGSMFLGYALANITLMGSLKTTGATIFLAPVLVLGLPIMDTSISIFRRILRGRPIFRGDNGHLHHRLLKKGYSQRAVVVIFYAIAAVMTTAAVVAWALPAGSPWVWVAYGCYGLAMLATMKLTDLGPPIWIKLIRSRQRNKIFRAFAHYISMRIESEPESTSPDETKILNLACYELGLNYLAIERDDGNHIVACHGDALRLGETDTEMRRIRVRSENNIIAYVIYQPVETLDEFGRSDLEDCLASICEIIVSHAPQSMGPDEPAGAEALARIATPVDTTRIN